MGRSRTRSNRSISSATSGIDRGELVDRRAPGRRAASPARARQRQAPGGGCDAASSHSRRDRTIRSSTSSAVASPSTKLTFGNAPPRSLASASSSGERSTPTTSRTYGASANARAPVPVPESSARSSPAGWTNRLTRSVNAARRLSSSSASRPAVLLQRSPDKLQRLLSRRDRPRRALLGDQLEQPARSPGPVATPARRPAAAARRGSRRRASRTASACPLRTDERERLQRPRLGGAAKPVDRPRRAVGGRIRAEQGVDEAAELVRDRQPLRAPTRT